MMKDYQKISDQIIEYYKLKKELKGLSAETLQNSKKEKHSYFLNIEHFLKNQIFDGGELLKILNDFYSEYSSKYKDIEEENGKLESALEEIKVIINGKKGTIIEDIENILR